MVALMPSSTTIATTCVTVPSAFHRGLHELAAEQGQAPDDVVRQAVALLAFARDQVRWGRRLGFFSEEEGRPVIHAEITLD